LLGPEPPEYFSPDPQVSRPQYKANTLSQSPSHFVNKMPFRCDIKEFQLMSVRFLGVITDTYRAITKTPEYFSPDPQVSRPQYKANILSKSPSRFVNKIPFRCDIKEFQLMSVRFLGLITDTYRAITSDPI